MLTSEQRDQIRAGGAPRLAFPGDEPCPLEPGAELPVASNLTIVVDRIRRSKKGEHVAVYTIRDFRVQLMRRVPPMFEPPELDAQGYPIPHDKEAIEKARVEGAVTSSSALAVPGDGGEFVPGEYQNVVAIQGRTRHAERQSAEDTTKRDLRSVTAQIRETALSMVRSGVDPQEWLTDLQRQVNEKRANMEEAA